MSMERVYKAIGYIIFGLFLLLQVPEIIGSVFIRTYKPEENLRLYNEINGNEIIITFRPDGKMTIAEKYEEDYMACFYTYSALKAFHIGPIFDNKIDGRYRMLGTMIRPGVEDVLSIHISNYKGAIVNGHEVELEDHLKGKDGRMILFRDGRVKWMGQYWEKPEESFAIDFLFKAFAGSLADGFEDTHNQI